MFISRTREKILRLFYERPERRIHLRGIVRTAGVNPQNAHKYLQEFVEDGLLLRSDSPQFVLYRLNPKNEILFKIFELFELRKKEEFKSNNPVLSRRLLRYMQVLGHLSENEIRIIVLFGPAARGEWSERSKVDILTVSSTKANPKKMARIHQEAAQKVRLMLTIESSNLAVDDFIQGFRKKKEFFAEFWENRIVLYNEFLFWRLIRESKMKTKNLIL